MAKNIVTRKENFAQWYQDVIVAGVLADHSPVRGCMVIRPNGFAIWEAMQSKLDIMFKETGHENAYFPLLIPESFIKKEAEHIEGFSPELAVVTTAGGSVLEEPLIVRPTSETIIGNMYSKWVKSYRDLPLLINQWSNVMRWELRPRLFLRTSEFLWQEGHTVHETAEEAEAETLQILNIYKKFLVETCAIPVITGLKPEHEKFPGALRTYTLEAMMQDGKALQSGTSHNFGQNFSKAFEIQFLNRDNQQEFAWTTSWGVSTRMIGGLIMTHGDDDGIIIPPRLAQTKVVIIPIINNEEQKNDILDFTDKCKDIIATSIGKLHLKVDQNHASRPAQRFFNWIQKGVPLRIEIGSKDMEKNSVVFVRRDNREKYFINIDEIAIELPKILESIQTDMYNKALSFQKENMLELSSYEQFKKCFKEKSQFVIADWDGTKETAQKIQTETKTTIRVILENYSDDSKHKCIYSQQPAKFKVIFANAY